MAGLPKMKGDALPKLITAEFMKQPEPNVSSAKELVATNSESKPMVPVKLLNAQPEWGFPMMVNGFA